MSRLALVTPEGWPLLTNEKATTPSGEGVETPEESLHVIAAREAAKQSTNKRVTK